MSKSNFSVVIPAFRPNDQASAQATAERDTPTMQQAPPTPDSSDQHSRPSKSSIFSDSLKRHLHSRLQGSLHLQGSSTQGAAPRETSSKRSYDTFDDHREPQSYEMPHKRPRKYILDPISDDVGSAEPSHARGDTPRLSESSHRRPQSYTTESPVDENLAELQRIRREHEALTRCIVTTLSREALEELMVDAALKYPAVLSNIMLSKSRNSVEASAVSYSGEGRKTEGTPFSPRWGSSVDTSTTLQREERRVSAARPSSPDARTHADIKKPHASEEKRNAEARHSSPDLRGSINVSASRQSGEGIILDDGLRSAESEASYGTAPSSPQLGRLSTPLAEIPHTTSSNGPDSDANPEDQTSAVKIVLNHKKPAAASNIGDLWTPEEDARLMAAKAAGVLWVPLQQQYFPGRTEWGLKKRYRRLKEAMAEDIADGSDDGTWRPGVTHDGVKAKYEPVHVDIFWTPEEDAKLLEARASGMSFAELKKAHFPNRSSNSCAKRFTRILNKGGPTMINKTTYIDPVTKQKVYTPEFLKNKTKAQVQGARGQDSMTLDDLLSPSEDEKENDMTLDDLVDASDHEREIAKKNVPQKSSRNERRQSGEGSSHTQDEPEGDSAEGIGINLKDHAESSIVVATQDWPSPSESRVPSFTPANLQALSFTPTNQYQETNPPAKKKEPFECPYEGCTGYGPWTYDYSLQRYIKTVHQDPKMYHCYIDGCTGFGPWTRKERLMKHIATRHDNA